MTAHVAQAGGDLKWGTDRVYMGITVANPSTLKQSSVLGITVAFGMAPGKVCALLPAPLDNLSFNCLPPLGWP